MKESNLESLYNRLSKLVVDEIEPEEVRRILDEEFQVLAKEENKK